MIILPKWVQRIFDESFCPHCEKAKVKTKLAKENVYALGIREEQSKKTQRVRLALYYEYKCPVCKKPSRFSGFPTTLHDYIADMIDISNSPLQDAITEHERRKRPMPKKEEDEIRPEGISDEEFNQFKEMTKDIEFFEDFLDRIGMTKEERDRLKEAYKENENEDK